MANFLTLRTGAASILKLDRAFFSTSVLPLLLKRGFPADAPFTVGVNDAECEKWLGGKLTVPAGTLEGTAATWRSLLIAATTRDAVVAAGRDLGGSSDPARKPAADWQRQKSGKRVKGRPKTRSVAPPPPPPPPSSSSARAASDPAEFAVQNLARLVTLVVAASKGAADAALVVVKDGAVSVDGVGQGPLTP